ncbi:MAG: hypothetical protein IPH07_02960 [Deltaproteobacteria bacterium]|nr:hypothetical protein [Deltaproteobacteria bacterium]
MNMMRSVLSVQGRVAEACVVAGAVLLTGCNDGTPNGTGAADGTAGTVTITDSASASATDGATTGDSASASATAATTVSSTAADSGSEAGETAPPPVVFDVGVLPDVGVPPCEEGGGKGPEFSFLWASNSSQGTISKIDTQTVTEVGRFITRPDGAGDPSRTSVSQSGHVAVANRVGGVTKIYADISFCEESNGTPGIQTSDDSTYLPWGEEECVAWHTPFNYESQRPVAWAQGTLDTTTCSYINERLWTAGRVGNNFDVLLLDGDTGVVVDQVAVVGLTNDFYGMYGGAVDGDGNFWASTLGSGNRLIRVDIDTMDYEIWNTPVGPHWYGMTVDDQNNVWLCSSDAARFDYATATFTQATVGGWTGCMAERGEDGLLWMASGNSLVGVNRETLAVDANWPVPGSYGVSIDFYGYVWTVENGNGAHRLDPSDGSVTSYNGLSGAYTYSDMTGYALTNAGGGVPSG